jgi:hypothetical protein
MTVLAFRDFIEINPDFIEEGGKRKKCKEFL